MREQKFRACINKNTVIYFTFEDLVNPRPLFSIRELLLPWLRKGNKPDDYIGLTDKNGKEIYEGDIVDFKDFHETIIIAEVKWCERGCWDYLPKGWDVGYPAYLCGIVEVIGNIWGHPELLG